MKRHLIIILMIFTLLCLPACGEPAPACPVGTGTPHYLTIPPESLATPLPASAPLGMTIGRKAITVDRVVEGPLCNGSWNGIVYVTCNVQVYPWTESPTFLKDCNLVIEPGTVVYVAAHNDTAYYNGCSCHTGEITTP